MTDLISNFHFLRPWWLLLLIVPLVGYRSFFSGMRNISAWEAVCDKKLLDFLLVKGSSRQRSFIGYTAIIGIVGAVLALSGPSWQKKNMPAFTPADPVMLLLNLSSDMDIGDVTPNRLSRAKFAINDLLGELKAQMGLIVYSDEPYLISPITDDRQIIANLLPAVNRDIMPTNGDKLGRAVDLAVERLKSGNYPNGTIVVFTADAGQEFNAALESCAAAASAGYQVYIVGVRSGNNEKLQMLADKGQGIYLNVNGGLGKLAVAINGKMSSELKKTENEREIWEDGGYYLLFIPLLCCLYFFRRGILVLVVWLAMSATASAGFFTNGNQDAAHFFAQGDYETAAQNFSRPDWKAAALYRQGNYVEALKYYQKGNDVEALYNQGNALAKSGKLEDAVKKYEEVLKQNPDHTDAKFNLEYLKQQQQEQQQSAENQNDSDNEKDNEQQSQPQGQSGENGDSANESTDNGEQGENDSDSQNDKGQSDNNGTSSEQNSDNGGSGEQQPTDGSRNAQAQAGSENGQSADSTESSVPSGNDPDEQSDEDAEGTAGRSQDEKGDFDEQSQAKEMAYRNIPEDAGGLLRAFIRKEYNKNRYGDK
uniref:BatB n=1 Tax=uncultured Alphaproteobacteria bacterium TaxID=91750 RepID=A0A6G8F2Y0_9PROT|nr:batB [uncultured Alphaproteobacteria bacterium]